MRPLLPAGELWRPVPEFEGIYEVSSLGRIRRLKSKQGTQAGKILAARPNRDGYPRVQLNQTPRKIEKLTHVLVLEVFRGPRPPGMEACHDDGNPSNAALSNLRWDTPVSNAADRERHGNTSHGERHPGARLTEVEVRAIKATTDSQRKIARDYGITQQTVSDIKRGRRWAHVA
jgi:hypothetical protein